GKRPQRAAGAGEDPGGVPPDYGQPRPRLPQIYRLRRARQQTVRRLPRRPAGGTLKILWFYGRQPAGVASITESSITDSMTRPVGAHVPATAWVPGRENRL